jgi:hypothetical protein
MDKQRQPTIGIQVIKVENNIGFVSLVSQDFLQNILFCEDVNDDITIFS